MILIKLLYFLSPVKYIEYFILKFSNIDIRIIIYIILLIFSFKPTHNEQSTIIFIFISGISE